MFYLDSYQDKKNPTLQDKRICLPATEILRYRILKVKIRYDSKGGANKMGPIEFKAEIKENMIKLPDFLKKMNLKNVRVIIFKDDPENALKKKLPDGFYDPLHAPTYRIIGKRDEIYDR